MKGSTGSGRAAAVLGGVALLALAACGGDRAEPSGRSLATPAKNAPAAVNQAPQLSNLVLEPRDPVAGSTVHARVQATDPDGDAVRLRYAWIVDGRQLSERGASIQVPADARKDATIEVQVVADDGRAQSEPLSATARVGDRPPAVTDLRLQPKDVVKVGQEVVAIATGSDPDGDPVHFEYQWRVNDRPAEGDRERFSTAGLKRGDRIAVRVVASDGDARSEPFDSAGVTVGNSAPNITSTPTGISADGVLRYTVEATDPDGDTNLRFRLAEGPPGARIDPVLGELVWKATADQVGTHPIEVVVEDGHGGETHQRFEVTVRQVAVNAAVPAAGATGQPPAATE
jgi:hypothetical protein